MGTPYRIRPARAADVPEIHAIEVAVFGDPWSARDFHECVAAHVPFFVAVEDGAVTGYVVAHGVAEEGEILNLGVAAAHRRKGAARALVERALAALAARGATAVFLEVRESNLAARRLYEQLGFCQVGRRPRYYRRPTEDAVLLRTAIAAAQGFA